APGWHGAAPTHGFGRRGHRGRRLHRCGAPRAERPVRPAAGIYGPLPPALQRLPPSAGLRRTGPADVLVASSLDVPPSTDDDLVAGGGCVHWQWVRRRPSPGAFDNLTGPVRHLALPGVHR